MNINFILSIFTCVMLLCSACAPSDRALAIADLTGDATSGNTVYQAECATCHGANAQGGSAPGIASEVDRHEDSELADEILEGPGSMPSFSQLSDQEIADILAYLHSL